MDTSFGPKQKTMLEEISQILTEYPDGSNILKELIQNADDAGASNIAFLLDPTQHPTCNLASADLSAYQGPALYSWNDSVFTREDWEGIQKVGRSVKEKTLLKVGRFGLGFVSVYHLSDTPTILSDELLGINHPLRELSNQTSRGVSIKIEQLIMDPGFSGHLSCFKGYFGYQEDNSYKGTIFRFPLRRERSAISGGVYDVTSVRERLLLPLMNEAEYTLLFLKSVNSIEIQEKEGDAVRILFRTEIPSSYQGIVKKYRKDISDFVSSGDYKTRTKLFVCLFPTISSFGGGNDSRENVWLVLNLIGFGAPDGDLLLFHSGQNLNYLPWVGLGLNTGVRDMSKCGCWYCEWEEGDPSLLFNSIKHIFTTPFIVDPETELDISTGRLFCFLPTQLDSKFPFHIHGYYCLGSNRRSIAWPANDNENDPGAKWNKLLTQNLTSIAYAALLYISFTALKHPSPLMYQYRLLSRWSPHEQGHTLFTSILCTGLRRLSHHLLLYSQLDGGKWLPITEAIFLPSSVEKSLSHEDVCLELFELLEQPIINVPPSISEIFIKIPEISSQIERRILTPVHIRDLLVRFSESLPCLEFLAGDNTCIALLEVLLSYALESDSSQLFLEGVPLLPIAGSSRPHMFRSDQDAMHYISDHTATHLQIFPGLDDSFVNPSIPKQLHSSLLSLARETSLNLSDLSNLENNPVLFSQLLTQSLSCTLSSTETVGSVTWRPGVSNHPPASWITQLYHFIGTSQPLISAVSHLPILPQHPFTNDVITLLPLQSHSGYIEIGTDLNLKWLERMLECSGCFMCEKQSFIECFRQFVLPPIPAGLIPALRSAQILTNFIQQLHDPQITDEMKFSLIDLLVPFVDSSNIDIIKQLPIFPNTQDEWLVLQPDVILPPLDIPSDIPYPSHFISPFNFSVRMLHDKLNIPTISTECFFRYHIIPFLVVVQNFDARNKLTVFVLENITRLDWAICEVGEFLKNTEWISDASTNCCLHPPSRLLDPRDAILRSLLFPHARSLFPSDVCQNHFDVMRRFLGVKSHGTLTLELLTEVCRCSVEILQSKRESEWRSTFHVLLDLLSNYVQSFDCLSWRGLFEIFEATPFMFPDESPPRDWPSSIRFHTSDQLCCPQDVVLCHPDDLYLIGSVCHTVSNSLYSTTAQNILIRMGVSSLSSHLVVRHLNHISQMEIICPNIENLYRMVSKIYSYLNNDVSFQSSDLESNIIFIPDECKFVSKEIVVFETPFELTPHLYSLRQLRFDAPRFFNILDVKQSPTSEQLSLILCEIKELDDLLSVDQLRIVIDILKYFVEQTVLLSELRIYVPGGDLRLYEPGDEKLVFWDNWWLDRNLIEEDFVIVHGSISSDLAYRLGVSPFSERVAPPSEDFWWEESGQQVCVTDRLRSILDAYSGTINVLKEMLQNADDARATEMRIVFDWRSHPAQSLLSTELKDWQGPAILFYNNSTFSDKDFQNIMRIDGATKAADAATIGRYGLGFCTVYHFTDVPSFVSRNYVHILDPQKKYISKSKGGRKIDFCNGEYVKFIRLYRDQFAPYEGVFGCDILNHQPFNGTLFRLPLRLGDISSTISLTKFDLSEMASLQASFVREAEGLLFFTQCIKSIGIYSIHDTTQSTELIHMVSKDEISQSPTTDSFLHTNKCLVERLYTRQPVTPVVSSCVYELTVKDKMKVNWIVIYATGSEACVDVIRKFPSVSVAPLPFAGVAMNLDLLQQAETCDYHSTLYCFFPLPISTSFPFHCHAMFELRQDRQGLVDSEENRTEWNKVLVSDPLVLATLTLYQRLAEMVKQSNNEMCLNAYVRMLYKMFSMEVLSDPLWRGFATAIAKRFSQTEIKLFPVTPINGVNWGNFISTYFLNIPSIRSDLRELFSPSFSATALDVLVSCGFPIAIIPDSISENSALVSLLFDIGSDNIINLRMFVQIFLANLLRIEKRIMIYVLGVLISACASHTWLREVIKSTQCVPCGDAGTLQLPCRVVDPNSQLVAQLFKREECRLPSEACTDALFSIGPVLDNLRTHLGLITTKLSPEELKGRAEYVSANCNVELAVRLIEYLDQKIFTGSEVEEMRSVLRNVPFIPVECPKIGESVSFCLKFFSPTDIIPFSMKSIGELQFPVCPESILIYQHFITTFILYNGDNLHRPIQCIAIDELRLCIDFYDKIVHVINLSDKVVKIYEMVGEHCQPDEYSEVPDNAILIPSFGFCDKSRLVLTSNEDFPPYIFSLSSYYARRSSCLESFFVRMGVNQTLSPLQCMIVIEDLYNRQVDVVLTPDERQIVLKFLMKISDSDIVGENRFMLSVDNMIHLAEECVFSDLNWENRKSGISFTKNGKTYYFIHPYISNQIAFKLGARPLSCVKLSGRRSLPFVFSSRGQSESLTTRLKNILSEYESNIDVFKELTQNADDAHATEIKFLFDYSHHGVERIIHPEMRHWQGPAIYCYNNATFSDADFESITKLAGRSKIEDQTTIGTYGIGFNTVYHLTDLPSFVSRRLVTFFDPQVLYLSGLIQPNCPGMQIDFVDEWDNLKEFSDQFSVYNGIFGCDLSRNMEYNGTLFRIPIRKQNISSEISQKTYDPKIFLRELHNNMLSMAKDLIMFLQNICSIELYVRTDLDNGLSLTHRVTKSPAINFISVNRKHFDNLLRGTSCNPITDVSTIRITTQSPPHPNGDPEEYIVSYSSGSKVSSDLVNRIKREYQVCTLPVCSVAVPKSLLSLETEELTDFKFILFCFLPLPCSSSYRMHINGTFQLQQSRRALHATSDGSFKTKWNQTLISDALPTAVVNMLIALTREFPTDSILTDQQLERYYSIWPDSNQDDILWGKFSLMIAKHIMNTDSRIFYCRSHPRRWIAFKEASLFISDPNIYTIDSEFIDVIFYFASLVEIYFINLPIQFIEHSIIMAHLNFDESNLYHIARACREILFPKFEELLGSNPGTVKSILYTLLQNMKYEPSLKELLTTEACFPCGEHPPTLRVISGVVSPHSVFAQLFYPEDKRLPNSLFNSFFDKELDPETSEALTSLGVIMYELPLDLLVDRCRKTLQLEPHIADQHVSNLLNYVNSMIPALPIQNSIRDVLQDIPFIPVYQDVIYNTICPDLICRYSSPSSCVLFNRRHLSPHYRAVTEEVSSLHHAMSLLGISTNRVPLKSVLESIFLIQDNIHMTNIGKNHLSETFKAIYLFVADACSSGMSGDLNCEFNKNLVQSTLADKDWVLNVSTRTFYPAFLTIISSQYQHYNSNFINYFQFPELLNLENFKSFLEFMKIPDQVSPIMAHKIICSLKDRFGDNPIPSTHANNESGLVILLINNVLKYVGEETDAIYLLTETNELQLASSLYLNDAPWLNYSVTECATFVHHDITLFASERLGANSRIGSICVDIPMDFEEFGQHEPIDNRIDTLLREFPCDVTIFKELIQNAEDAGATEVGIVLDCQSYGEESLCLAPRYQKKWKELQRVPSLLIYNNRPFTEDDIKGIQAVGIGGKQGKNTIGRFGLGFNSVFHLTRVPCLLTCSEDGSQSNFCVFDPYRAHLNIPSAALPGLRRKINTSNLKDFPHQFSPYFLEPIVNNYNDQMHNLRKRKCFSIFRLPLNIQGIGDNVKRIENLLSDLIREAPRLLPFISHVKNLDIFHIKSEGTTTFEGIIRSEIISRQNSLVERPIYGHNQSIKKITKKVTVTHPLTLFSQQNVPITESDEVRWLIYHFDGNLDALFQESDALQENVDVYNREKLKLFSSIAVETVSQAFPVPTQKRYLYCHLPFGNSLKFPVHINCPFILDPHRRYVSYQDELTGRSSWDNIWHSEILNRVLTPLYFKLLLDLGPGGERHSDLPDAEYFDWYYSLFPVIHETDCGSNSMEFLQSLGRAVLKRIYENNSSILLADDISITATRTWYSVHGANGGIFKYVQEGYHHEFRECAKCLFKLHYPFTYAPLSLANSFTSCGLNIAFLEPLEILRYINNNRDKLAKPNYSFPCSLENCVLNLSEINTILKCILEVSEDGPKDCIPLKIDCNCYLGILNISKNSCFRDRYVNLLPHHKPLFLSCSHYNRNVIKLLVKHNYVENLNAEFLAFNLQVPNCLSAEFLLLFWTFIIKLRLRPDTIISLFKDYILVPVIYGTDSSVSFLPIRDLRSIATENSTPKCILQKLDCPFLCLEFFQIENPSSVYSHMNAIRNLFESLVINYWNDTSVLRCIGLCKNIEMILSEEEACVLRELFQDTVYCRNLDFNRTLLRLKIFVAYRGATETALVALNGFKIYFNDNNFPLNDDLIQRLENINVLFLSNDQDQKNLIHGLAKSSYLNIVDDVTILINDYILDPTIFPPLQPNFQIELIQFFDGLNAEIGWMDILIQLQFIKTDHGIFKPSELFRPDVELFVIYKNERLLPECWTESHEIYQKIQKLGLILEISLDIILESAQDVTDYFYPKSYLTKLTFEALGDYIDNRYKDNTTENMILQQLANIPFVPLFEVSTLISSEQDPGRIYRLGYFYEAQLYKHHDYCCTTSPIFDPIVSFSNEKVIEIFNLNTKPPIQSVKDHLQNLMTNCRNLSQEEIKTYLENFILHTYGYLQESSDLLTEFQNTQCIVYDGKLYSPINIVLNWTFNLFPYLFQCPAIFNPYKKFLSKVGVSESASYKHLKSVLNSIRMDNGSDHVHFIQTSDCKCELYLLAKNAFNYLIEELRSLENSEDVELEGMLLLTTKHELIGYDSPNLFYADNTQLMNRVLTVFPDIRILAQLNYDQYGSPAPPPSLKLKFLSNIFRQTLCNNVYDNILPHDERTQVFQTRLKSSEVYTALKRIYFHQTSKDLNKLKFRDGFIYTEGDNYPIEEGYYTFKDKIQNLSIIAVNTIDIIIIDTRVNAMDHQMMNNTYNCMSFLDISENNILINTDQSYAEKLPVEMAYELNQYFCNIFERSLFHLLICLQYPGEEIELALNNFNVKQLPPDLS